MDNFSKNTSSFFPDDIRASFVVIILLVFLGLRWQSLHLPFFWDEAWSYIPAIRAMTEQMPCLLPNCIEPELYRGHPLLFYFLTSLWAKIFGTTPFSFHLFAWGLSALTLWSFYRLADFLFDKNWAIVAMILLMIQVAFYVQSVFVLPEILVTLLTIECILAYFKNKHWAFVLAASLLLLSKESGLIILAAFYIVHFLWHFKNIRQLFRNSWHLLMPLIPFLAFFIYQKLVLDWWFYPLHTSMIDLSWNAIQSKSTIIFNFLFFEQGRWMFWFLLAVWWAYSYWKKDKIFAAFSGISSILGVLIIYQNWSAWRSLLLVPIIWMFFKKFKTFTSFQKQVALLFSILFLSYFLFSATNFLMLRYVICLLPIIILTFIFFWKNANFNPLQNIGSLVVLIFFFFFVHVQNKQKSWIDDVSRNYIDMVKIHQEAITFCEAQNWQTQSIGTHFLMTHNLKNPAIGYLKGKAFSQVSEYRASNQKQPNIAIISSIEKHYNFDNIKNDTTYTMVKKWEDGSAWCKIYAKKTILQPIQQVPRE